MKYFRDVLGGDIDIEDIETKYVKIKNDEKIDFGIPESNSGLPYLDGDE